MLFFKDCQHVIVVKTGNIVHACSYHVVKPKQTEEPELPRNRRLDLYTVYRSFKITVEPGDICYL